LLNSRTLNE